MGDYFLGQLFVYLVIFDNFLFFIFLIWYLQRTGEWRFKWSLLETQGN